MALNRPETTARAGGLARVRIHGNPGTPEGRKLGGSRSLKMHAYLGTRFKLLRKIPAPRKSLQLAELLGILAGDGHVGEYQTAMYTNSITDREHALHTKMLFESVFPIKASLRFRPDCNACVVFVSSKEICRHFVSAGMVQGNKIGGDLCMPPWVRKSRNFRQAYVRGLFDTDGSVYVDVHRIRGREYRNIGMAFTNRCLPLLNDFKETLILLGFHPTQKTKYVVFLRREGEICRYFDLIGTSNPKHKRRFSEFLRIKRGGVA